MRAPLRDALAGTNFLFCLVATTVAWLSIEPQKIHYWLAWIFCITFIFWISLHWNKFLENNLYVGYIFLLTVLSLYSFIPIALLANEIEIFPHKTATIKNVFTAHIIYINNLHLFIYLTTTAPALKKLKIRFQDQINDISCTQISSLVVSLIGLLIAALYLQNYHSSGVDKIVGTGSRLEVAQAVETGKTWLLQYLFAGWAFAYMWLMMAPHRSPRLFSKLIAIGAAGIFLFPYFSVGNRRELASFLIFIAILAITLKKYKILSAAILGLPIVASLGLLRAGESGAVSGAAITNLFGEFIFPHYPLLFYAEAENIEPLFGFTYFRFPAYILPNFGLWEKAQSLAYIFIKKATNDDMGYAYTPLAEGYINYQWAGILITPALLVISLLILSKAFRKNPLYWILALAFALDIARGEFIAILYQWMIYSITIYGVLAVNRWTSKKISL